MILYPDQRHDQPENNTVCYAAPIEKCDWEFMYYGEGMRHQLTATDMRFVILEGEDQVYFMRNDSEVTDRVCILLRTMEDTDTCIESAAWIRIQENFPGMIYIVQGSTYADKYQRYHATIGAPEDSVCMVDFTTVVNEETDV